MNCERSEGSFSLPLHASRIHHLFVSHYTVRTSRNIKRLEFRIPIKAGTPFSQDLKNERQSKSGQSITIFPFPLVVVVVIINTLIINSDRHNFLQVIHFSQSNGPQPSKIYFKLVFLFFIFNN